MYPFLHRLAFGKPFMYHFLQTCSVLGWWTYVPYRYSLFWSKVLNSECPRARMMSNSITFFNYVISVWFNYKQNYLYRNLPINWKLMMLSGLSSNAYAAISTMLLISTISLSGAFFMQVFIIQSFKKIGRIRQPAPFRVFCYWILTRLKVVHGSTSALLLSWR